MTNHNKPNFQKLSQSQIQAKRENGLCFYCDEKYTYGHKCKASVHVLIVPDLEEIVEDDCVWENSDEVQQVEPEVVNTGEPTPPISLYAMSGVFLPQTLKFKVFVGKLDVYVLVDGGSTHNFIQSRIFFYVEFAYKNKHFEVMVGKGKTLKCEGMCAFFPIQIEKKVFLIIFYILPIQGTNVVLGVRWLQLLGPIVLDYQKLIWNFHVKMRQSIYKETNTSHNRFI